MIDLCWGFERFGGVLKNSISENAQKNFALGCLAYDDLNFVSSPDLVRFTQNWISSTATPVSNVDDSNITFDSVQNTTHQTR